ncbi:MAG: UvrD-helicase domain-containing protein [Pseudomarimonas sp.]
MRILEYIGLDTTGVASQYRKVTAAIAVGDFRVAQVKKLAGPGQGTFYRAKLNDADRLLFTLVRHAGECAVLVLEVIRQHDYGKSRFLRGAQIDEAGIEATKLIDAVPADAQASAQPLRYLHPERGAIHLLGKPISFDEAQQAVYQQAPPLIVVGSAGSGKTALTLEKLKQAGGEVLYVTHSAFLAQSARDLYFAQGFERADQEASFLSLRDFIETLRVPVGKEAGWRSFAVWFARQRQTLRDVDAHQAFEEIRGVIAAQADGVLSRESYRALGIRQSIFADDQRDALFDVFEKYRQWLVQDGLFDLNLLAHERLDVAAPRYDFIVIDEVQDLTSVQLALILKTLKKPGQFLLCGDSNQIVHPNFFAWSHVKTLFWRDAELAGRQQLSILEANFRNSGETTRIANTLLKIKHRRFGSIDRESNFLVRAVGAEAGQAVLLSDKDNVVRELDKQSRQSTEVAVLVLREEDKSAARKHFATPLLFCVHEAKGLEYENIVLFRFVSDNRSEFSLLCEGVTAADLEIDDLAYRRARDKSDKALEVHKFFVNALYVALTRAQKNVYLVESDLSHPLFGLLSIGADDAAKVSARTASREDWQREAHKLELQGKLEQAESIRRDLLKQAAPPWPVFDEPRLRDLLIKVFRQRLPGSKQPQQLFEYAAIRNCAGLAEALSEEVGFCNVREFERSRPGILSKHFGVYASRNFKDVLRDCDRFGVDHRTPFNITPLMAAAGSGNLALVEALLDRGADSAQTDDFGQTPLHWALRTAFSDREFARGPMATLYARLAPSAIDLQAGQRLIRIDRQHSEYLLLQTLWVVFRERVGATSTWQDCANFDSKLVLGAWQHLPAAVLRTERNKRQHVSALFARNEVSRDYAYNRALFRRVGYGRYQFDPGLCVRVVVGGDSSWVPVLSRLNVALSSELVRTPASAALQGLVREAGLGSLPVPIIGEAMVQAEHARLAKLEAERQALIEQRDRLLAARAKARAAAQQPKWGTPEAKRLLMKRIKEANEARRRSKLPPE